jgi:galactokinase
VSLSPAAAAACDRAAALFRDRFGTPHEWWGIAPGRVNLIGEHTDYNDGFVLPIAIERHCVALAAPAAGARSRVILADLNRESAADLLRPATPADVERGSPESYILSVAALMAAHAARAMNLDLLITSTVPFGSGLSSSASLEIAVASALERAWGARLAPTEKALLGQRAEHEFAGVPCGIMDQFISVIGRADHALLVDCRDRTSRHVPIPAAARIIVMNTGVHHSLAAGEYAKRRDQCRAAAQKLGVRSLRLATPDEVERCGTLSKEQHGCARHVTTENDRVRRAAQRLDDGDLPAVGQLMLESHGSLRVDYRVSCAELDTLVELAAATPGVYGARMTGAGFGGCAIALCEPGAIAALVETVSRGYREKHTHKCEIFETTAADGAAAIDAAE